jgi:hypothetical protein
MKKAIIILFLFILPVLFILQGCGSRQVIKEQDLTVKIPEIKQTMNAEIKNAVPEMKTAIEDFISTIPDSVYFHGTSVVVDSGGHTTTMDVKFYPNRKIDPVTNKPAPEFQLKVKQPDIHLPHLEKEQPVPKETFWDKFGSAVSIGAFILILIVGVLVILKFFILKR